MNRGFTLVATSKDNKLSLFKNNAKRFVRRKIHMLLYPLLLTGLSPVSFAHVAHHHLNAEAMPSHQYSAITWSNDKKIHLYGITLTPGGFLAGEAVWRSRNEQTDIGSAFNGIPLGNNPLYHMHEFRLSARQTRASLLIEGVVNPCVLLSGYYEADFLGNGTANSNESNSFDVRSRHLYSTLDIKNRGRAFQLLAGQTWSLATMNYKGITPRNELVPPTIDAQYVVGFVWKRQPQFRLTFNFAQSLWAAVSVENPQTTFGGTPCGTPYLNVVNQICKAPGQQTLPSTTLFSINHIPDFVGKVAYEAKFAKHNIHVEAFGLLRSFYDRVEYTNHDRDNHDSRGYGIGAGAVIELWPGVLDFEGNFLTGRGIGSYATGLLPDVTLGRNGALKPIPEVAVMLGLTLHATPCLDIYLFGGEEKESRKYFRADDDFIGYGVPNANNIGCRVEDGTCHGDTHKLTQVTVGFWDKLYKGPYGEMRMGMQYSRTIRRLFSGTGGQDQVLSPKEIGYSTNDNMVFFSVRYYPFT